MRSERQKTLIPTSVKKKKILMKVTVVSPERIVFSGEVDSVAVPGAKGRFEILNNHAPIVSALTAGKVVCSGKETLELDILGGFVEVARNEVSVCVETSPKA